MRLVTFADASGGPRLGLVRGDRVHAVPGMRDVLDAIDAGSTSLSSQAEEQGRPMSELRLLAPIVKPRRNVFCVGRNYFEHRAEADAVTGNKAADEWPTFFTKVPETVVGPEAEVKLYGHISTALDWEAELVAVIGKGGIDIAEDDALSHVYGYTAGNDVTMRDVQRRHGNQWFKGKSMDTHAPMGPVLVTADEFGDPQNHEVMCRVNGEEKQRSNTSLMIYTVKTIIAELSKGMRLNPGDLIMTGTPSGVGFARKPPEFMKAGDVVEVEIPAIGVLRNSIVNA